MQLRRHGRTATEGAEGKCHALMQESADSRPRVGIIRVAISAITHGRTREEDCEVSSDETLLPVLEAWTFAFSLNRRGRGGGG
jgi:hypothetical protein